MLWGAIVVAAGRGTRFGQPKQLVDLAGLPMVGWSLQTFASMPEISNIIVVTEADSIDAMRTLCAGLLPSTAFDVVAGGSTRQASVACGLAAMPERCNALLVHDSARPLVRASDVRVAMAAVSDGKASLLAIPVTDTIKAVDAKTMTVRTTVDRDPLWAAQTPQLATARDLRRSHAQSPKDAPATDDAVLLERSGVAVSVIPSTSANFKVTVQEDLACAELLLHDRLEHVPTQVEVLLVEVFADETLSDAICAELESRKATIDAIDRDLPRGIAVRAFVATEDLRGFGERFDAFANGTATYTTRFSHYAGRDERTAGDRA